MSIIKIKSKDFELELTVNSETLREAELQLQSSDITLEVALIAMALNEYGSFEFHDYESGIITIKRRVSEWSSKILGLNERIKSINE